MSHDRRTGYDIIGDIHGHAGKLTALLNALGYEERDGSYRHPERRVILLGDFIDRGPEIRETLRIARAMVERGHALAVMGNHEYNALCYAKPDGKGGFFRPHTEGNVNQHAATLEAFKGRQDEWHSYLEWFAKLPLFLNLGGLRVVHACWDDDRHTLIIAKGMGNYETISEFDGERPVVYVMNVKCVSVAEALNRRVGEYIAIMGEEHG